MDGLNMSGQTNFLRKTLVAFHMGAREGGMDRFDVSGQVVFQLKALAASLMWTGEGRQGGRVDGVYVCV